MTALVLGIDVGTGGVKTLLLDASGRVRATAFVAHPLSTPRPRYSEQDPANWWDGVVGAIAAVCEHAAVTPSVIEAIGLTGQMHGLVLLDERDRVLRPAILWNDQRTDAECRLIHERLGEAEMIRVTGKPVLTGFTAPKILWVARNEPEVYARVRHVLLPKDYVRQRLTGAYATDVADASGTSLLDLSTRGWSKRVLDALEIPAAWMPTVGESPAVSAHVSTEAAARTGLAAGTPVVNGAGDQAAEAIGCGVTQPGPVSVTIGTSGVVFAASATPPIDDSGRLHGFCHAVPGMWHVMGVMLSAGGSLRWFRDTLAADLL
ncbi:MAG: xylulokinase, partial [Phycisphaerales bacterium]|nr:xylulokinase [Phycisphaerae bacterium]NNM26043.1 xylulokinase [Phycisphaerales bacterium]